MKSEIGKLHVSLLPLEGDEGVAMGNEALEALEERLFECEAAVVAALALRNAKYPTATEEKEDQVPSEFQTVIDEVKTQGHLFHTLLLGRSTMKMQQRAAQGQEMNTFAAETILELPIDKTALQRVGQVMAMEESILLSQRHVGSAIQRLVAQHSENFEGGDTVNIEAEYHAEELEAALHRAHDARLQAEHKASRLEVELKKLGGQEYFDTVQVPSAPLDTLWASQSQVSRRARSTHATSRGRPTQRRKSLPEMPAVTVSEQELSDLLNDIEKPAPSSDSGGIGAVDIDLVEIDMQISLDPPAFAPQQLRPLELPIGDNAPSVTPADTTGFNLDDDLDLDDSWHDSDGSEGE